MRRIAKKTPTPTDPLAEAVKLAIHRRDTKALARLMACTRGETYKQVSAAYFSAKRDAEAKSAEAILRDLKKEG